MRRLIPCAVADGTRAWLPQVVCVGTADAINALGRGSNDGQELVRNRYGLARQRIKGRDNATGLGLVFPAQIQFDAAMNATEQHFGFRLWPVTVLR
jgi:hypothetical protein